MDNGKRLEIDQTFTRSIWITEAMMNEFETLSGDTNRLHTDRQFARGRGFRDRVSYGNILGFLISSLVGVAIAEYEVMLISQSILYRLPLFPGDGVRLEGRVVFVSDSTRVAELKLLFRNQNDALVATGKCQVKEFEA